MPSGKILLKANVLVGGNKKTKLAFGLPEQNAGIRGWFEASASRWGRQAGGRYAQAFYSDWPLRSDGPLAAAGV